MGRWLAPLLPGPQHWVAARPGPRPAAVAAADLPGPAADGARSTVETRRSDITRLDPDDLAGATLITASALLDLLTGDELARLVDVCAGAGCPALLTLSVVGRVELAPARPARRAEWRPPSTPTSAARRRGGRLLGPDAVAAAVDGVPPAGGRGARPAQPLAARRRPGRPGGGVARGWVGAACEQEAELAAEADAYARPAAGEARAGQLAVTVDHADLLVCRIGQMKPGSVTYRGRGARGRAVDAWDSRRNEPTWAGPATLAAAVVSGASAPGRSSTASARWTARRWRRRRPSALLTTSAVPGGGRSWPVASGSTCRCARRWRPTTGRCSST